MKCCQALLLGMGLQHKVIDNLASELELPATQLLGLFNRSTRRMVNFLVSLLEHAVEETLLPRHAVTLNPPTVQQSLQQEMDHAAQVSFASSTFVELSCCFEKLNSTAEIDNLS